MRFALALLAALSASAAFSAPLECPQAPVTAAAVDAWRLEAALALQSGTLTDAQVAQRIDVCFAAAVPSCMKRVQDYATRNVALPTSQDGTAATLDQKRPPDELLKPGANGLEYILPENIEALAAEKGWPAVRYKSRHAGGFDSETPSLLMVYVPGDKVNPPVGYDRWLNFALPADIGEHALTPKPQAKVPDAAAYAAEGAGGLDLPRTFTMVTLDRKTESTQGQVYFQKFYRGGSGSPIFKPESNSSPSSCVSCHPNGLRAISPLGFHVRAGEAQLPEEDWKTVELINKAMDDAAGNKAVSWRGYLNTKGHGPFVGPGKPFNGISRSKEFIMGGTLPDGTTTQGCFKRRTQISVLDIFGRDPGKNNIYKLQAQPQIAWENVAGAMKCATCHNDSTRGAINRQTSWSQIDFKILVDQSMPLGAHSNPIENGSPEEAVQDSLTADERIALTNCLQAEYELEQKHLQKWLTQQTCQ